MNVEELAAEAIKNCEWDAARDLLEQIAGELYPRERVMAVSRLHKSDLDRLDSWLVGYNFKSFDDLESQINWIKSSSDVDMQRSIAIRRWIFSGDESPKKCVGLLLQPGNDERAHLAALKELQAFL